MRWGGTRAGRWAAALAAVAACAFPAGAAASETGSSTATVSLTNSADVDLAGQTFTVPALPATDNLLHTLRINALTATGMGTFRVYVTALDGSDLPTGAPLFTSPPISRPIFGAPVSVYPNITVTPGDNYGFYFDNAATVSVNGATTNPYAGGNVIRHLISTNAWEAVPTDDMAFLAQFSAGQGATQTVVVCPATGGNGEPSVCTVTVSNRGTGLGTPSGTVALSTVAGSGSFTPCVLNGAGQCNTTFTPLSGGSIQVNAQYSGDATHLTSSGSTFVDVGRRSTSVLPGGCVPAQTTVGRPVTCAATVTDRSGGALSSPSGTIAWASTLGGTFTPSNQCTVTPTGTLGSSVCGGITFTPTVAGRHQLLASYSGGPGHRPSGTVVAGEVSVSPAPAEPQTNCKPLQKQLKRIKQKRRKAEGKAKRKLGKKVKRARNRLKSKGC